MKLLVNKITKNDIAYSGQTVGVEFIYYQSVPYNEKLPLFENICVNEYWII